MTADAVETVLKAALKVENGGGLDVRLRHPLAVSLSAWRGFGEGDRLLVDEARELRFTDSDDEDCGDEADGIEEGGLSVLGPGIEAWGSRDEGSAAADSSIDALLASPFFFFSSASLRCCSS